MHLILLFNFSIKIFVKKVDFIIFIIRYLPKNKDAIIFKKTKIVKIFIFFFTIHRKSRIKNRYVDASFSENF